MNSITEPSHVSTRAKRLSKRTRPVHGKPSHDAQSRANMATTDKSLGTMLEVRDIKKDYTKGKLVVPVLRGVSLQVQEGEFCAIVGKSGSGKSTLLHLMGTLDNPTSGEIHFQNGRIDNLPSRKRDRLRNQKFGLIFQFYHLLPELTCLENVLMPRMISDGIFKYWAGKRKHVQRAKKLLDIVGLSHRLNHRPREMSGGEMQRVAIARALISKPELLLADEPTGNLDAENGAEVMRVLEKLRHEESLTVVMVTHDDSIAQTADRHIRLENGVVAQP